MKIKELHLRNIASIETADIDFEKNLVDSVTGDPASIFLISGDTGAGKSVILDGISMALYKNTPRISGTENKTNNIFTDNNGESISVKSIEQYTRLGISEKDDCYSEVVFEGNDGKEYRVRLELGMKTIRGKKDKDGNNLLEHKVPNWKVKIGNGDWQKVEAKTGRPVLDAIGLSFEQFGRMAMLAQGQFASFLTGDKTERECILEKLTNTSKFSTYGTAISNIYKRKKEEKGKIQAEFDTNEVHILQEEEVEKLKQEKAEFENTKKTLEEDKKKVQYILDRVKSIHMEREKRDNALKQKQELEDTANTDEFKHKEATVNDWDNTDSERQSLINKRNAEKQREEALTDIEKAREIFAVLSADLAWRWEELKKVENNAKELQDWMDACKDNATIFENAETICTKIEHYKTCATRVANTEKTLKEEQDKTEELNKKVATCAEKKENAEAKVKAKQDEINQLTTEREELHPQEIFEKKNKAVLQKEMLAVLNDDIAELNAEREGLQDTLDSISDDENQLKLLQKQYDDAEENYKQKLEVERQTNSLLVTMQMNMDDKITELRKQLHDNHAEVCPLCGQSIDASLLNVNFDKVLSPLQKKQEKAKNDLDKASQNRDKHKTAFDNAKGAFEQKKSEYDKKKKETDKKENEIKVSATSLGLNVAQPLEAQVKTAIDQTETVIRFLDGRWKKAEELIKEIEKIGKDKVTLDKALEQAQKQYSTAVQNVESNKIRIDEQQSYLNDNRNEKKKLEEELNSLLLQSYPTWKNDIENAMQRLTSEAKEYNTKKDALDKCVQDKNKASELITTILKTSDSICSKQADWEGTFEPKEYISDDINNEWTILYGLLEGKLNSLEKANATIAETSEILQKYYESAEKSEETLARLIEAKDSIEDFRQQVQKNKSEINSHANTAEYSQKYIIAKLKELQIDNIEDMPEEKELEDAITEKETKIVDASTRCGSIVENLRKNEENEWLLKESKEKLDRATAVVEKWERINAVFGGSRFRNLVQTYILRPLLNNANIYLSKITDRYILTCSDDNEQLSILVLDKYNKKQMRSVTVLSGGERFMISLALSLALSSLNRQDMNVNILFIDEGFGTLDETNLNSVMSTLEKLQEIAGQSNRRVGIISHREELMERIPVKISVKKRGEGRSSVEITSE